MTRPDAARRALDPGHFRQVLGHFASGVTVITAVHEGTPVGFACQSFTSLSLDPPLVTFAPARTSTSWPRIRAAGRFCANVLAADQADLCRAFAARGGEKFAGLDWRRSGGGSPILADVLAWVDATLEAEYDGGDHAIVVGRVLDLQVVRDSPPLVFHRGGYRTLSDPDLPLIDS